jgi:hypothetical protein
LKWLLVAVAILLVVAISVGVTLFFTRDGSGGDGPTSTASSPSANDIASADDTGPVAIITSDPTCDSWSAVGNALFTAEGNGWDKRDPSVPASDWTPEQRAQFESVGNTMRTTADQAVELAKRTPHRVMRELYAQFIAYGRAYADALPSYTSEDEFLARTNVAASSSLTAVCSAISYGHLDVKAPLVPPAEAPTEVSDVGDVGDVGDPQRFITESDAKICATWVANSAKFDADLVEWTTVDPNIPAIQWTPDQRAIQENGAKVFGARASEMIDTGRRSGNPEFEDFAVLAALYFQAYSQATANYTLADEYVGRPGLRLNNLVTYACQGAAG